MYALGNSGQDGTHNRPRAEVQDNLQRPVLTRPLPMLALAYGVGVIVAPHVQDHRHVLGWSLLALAVVGFWLVRFRRPSALAVLGLIFVCAGLSAPTVERSTLDIVGDEQRWAIEGGIVDGVIAAAPIEQRDGVLLTVELIGTSTSMVERPLRLHVANGRVRMTVSTRTDCGEMGDRVRFWAQIQRPGPPPYPGATPPEVIAKRRGIDAFGHARLCVVVNKAPNPSLLSRIQRFRQRVHRAIDEAVSPSVAALVRAFATGDRAKLDPQILEAFNGAGLSHLIAVSGFNLVIVGGMMMALATFVVRRLPPLQQRWGASRVAAVCTIPFVFAYAEFVGATPSAIRATWAFAIGLLGLLLWRRGDPWTIVASCALVIVAADATAIYEPSFQLSFAAVGALLRIYPWLCDRICPKKHVWPAWRRFFVDVALATIAATLGTIPVVAVHFQRLSLVSVFANLPAAPLASFVLVPGAFVAGVVGAIAPAVAAPLFAPIEVAARGLVWIADVASSSNWSVVAVPPPNALEIALFVGVIWLLTSKKGAKSRLLSRPGWAVVGLTTLAVSFAWQPIARSFSRTLRMTALAVGQGDCIVLEMPGGSTVVVDSGPAYEASGKSAATEIVVPFLRDRRIFSIDLLVLTHPHADHVGGASDLIQAFDVHQVWENGDRREDALGLNRVLRAMRTKTVKKGEPPLLFNGATLSVLGPARPPQTYRIVNDGSIVLSVDYGSRRFLLMGDAERTSELELVDQGALGADVLKVGHHGSGSSSQERFLETVSPSIAVVSLGRFNRFRFPNRVVLERLNRRGVRWARTDEGPVVIETDGRDLRITSERKEDASR